MEAATGKRTVLIVTLLVSTLGGWRETGATSSCEQLGWFPVGLDLKDHHVFWYHGYYYLVSTYPPANGHFIYGRTTDFCSWEDLPPILTERIPGAWDELAIWAPFVYKEGGVYYMFYAGVTHALTQSIMLATSTHPADPAAWQEQGMVFQPDHPGMIWQNGTWADCRDPMVLRVAETYYLYYTGQDAAGGIVGLATATSPLGPWQDWGAILVLPGGAPESATVVAHGGLYYLFYKDSTASEHYRIGPSPAGPWSTAYPFAPGWAHEIWPGQDGYQYTSFLTDNTVTISRLTWDTFFAPPRPFIGERVYHVLIPLILN